MPLEQSGSRAALGHNIAKEVKAGKPKDQAIAIAYNVKRKNESGKAKKKDMPK